MNCPACNTPLRWVRCALCSGTGQEDGHPCTVCHANTGFLWCQTCQTTKEKQPMNAQISKAPVVASGELLGCPFCSCDFSLLLDEHEEGEWLVICNACGTKGPPCATRDLARAAWNGRAPHPSGLFYYVDHHEMDGKAYPAICHAGGVVALCPIECKDHDAACGHLSVLACLPNPGIHRQEAT